MKVKWFVFGVLFVLSGSQAQAAVDVLVPDAYATLKGRDGGQPVGNLALLDQSGDEQDPDRSVVCRSTWKQRYVGHRNYFLPGGINPGDITALQVRSHYRGPARHRQRWAWKIYNWTDDSWVTLGDNSLAPHREWKIIAFNVPGNPADFVDGATGEIVVKFVSSRRRGRVFLDYEAVHVATGNLPPPALADARTWGYQLQSVAGSGKVEHLVNSHYDMLVLEPTRTDWSSIDREFDTAGMVQRLKNSFAGDGMHRKLVIAYIDIGEAEDWRWYWTWSKGWNCQGTKPADWPEYIITCDPDGWEGNYPVAYWDPAWKDIIIYGQNQDSLPWGNYGSAIEEAILDGFDGIYLDWVEAFADVQVIAAAQAAGKDPAAEMIAFIGEMQAWARVRNPNFLIIQQNASHLSDGRPTALAVVDAIAQEEVWYAGVATDRWRHPRGYDIPVPSGLTDWYLTNLARYQTAGLPVFNCEYARWEAPKAYRRSYRNGFIPYASRRSLGRLTGTPPPIY